MSRLLGMHGASDPVAFGEQGERSAAQLLSDAARVARVLPEPTPGSHVLLVFQRDRYLMAAALLGAFHRGHAVTLPPNTRRDTIFELSGREDTAAILHDTEAGLSYQVERVLAEAGDVPPLRGAAPPDRDIVATVFTSGTTSAMSPWPKRAEQLLGEAWMLGESFDIGPGARVVGTVSPGHIYGLLYTVLLPLLRGGSFLRETPLHPEAVGARVAAHDADVLVTVPPHLRAFEAVDAGVMSSLTRVFASTAPLSEGVAARFHERHGVPVTEILGSTETGGIAARQRTAPGARFNPLGSVEVTVDDEGRLWVDSPFVDAGAGRPFRTADLAELSDDGSFLHLGRADRVVKVGGRRVSLPAIEEAMRAVSGVRDAALVALEGAPGRGAQLLAAVAGSEQTGPAIREALLARFDPSTLPRRTVFVGALPREENGKLTQASLMRLFGLRPDGTPIVWEVEPSAPRTTHEEERVRHEVRFAIPEALGYFDGHFEGYPLLPGAAQLSELVVPQLRALHPELGRVKGFSKLKFLGRIEPGDEVSLVLELREGGVSFELRKAGELCSAGSMELAEGSA